MTITTELPRHIRMQLALVGYVDDFAIHLVKTGHDQLALRVWRLFRLIK